MIIGFIQFKIFIIITQPKTTESELGLNPVSKALQVSWFCVEIHQFDIPNLPLILRQGLPRPAFSTTDMVLRDFPGWIILIRLNNPLTATY